MDEVEQKQKYLCDNILEQGYDAEDFAEFCERFKGNMDITSWTFQELEEVPYLASADCGQVRRKQEESGAQRSRGQLHRLPAGVRVVATCRTTRTTSATRTRTSSNQHEEEGFTGEAAFACVRIATGTSATSQARSQRRRTV